jgi:putative ABC transport system permease protein
MMLRLLESAVAEMSRRPAFVWRVALAAAIAAAVAQPLGQAALAELSYDRWLPDAEQIFRIQGESRAEDGTTIRSARAPGVAAPFMRADLDASMLGSVVTRAIPRRVVMKEGPDPSFVEALIVDPEFLSVFDLPMLAASADGSISSTPLKNPTAIVVTEAFARSRFGSPDVTGRSLTLNLGGVDRPMIVAGVLNSFPGPTHMKFEALVPLQLAYFPNEPWVMSEWFANSAYTYIRVGSPKTDDQMSAWLGGFQRARTPGFIGPNSSRNELVAVRVINIHLGASGKSDMRPAGALRDVLSLLAAGVLAVAICAAVIVMLCAAEAAERGRELRVRLTLGASPASLRASRAIEVGILLLIGTLLGAVLAAGVASHIDGLRIIAAAPDTAWHFNAPILFGVWLMLVLPATPPFLRLVRPSTPRSNRLNWLPATSLGVQFFTTALLAGAAYLWYAIAQVSSTVDYGIQANRLFIANAARPSEQGQLPEGILQRIAGDPAFEAAAAALVVPGENFSWSVDLSRGAGTKPVRAEINFVTPSYFSTLGTKVLSGRSFNAEGSADDVTGRDTHRMVASRIAVMLDEEAAHALGFSTAEESVGKVVDLDHWLEPVTLKAEVVGVVARHALLTAQAREKPARVFVFDSNWATSVIAKSAPGVDAAQAMRALQLHWRTFSSDTPFRGSIVSDTFSSFQARARLFLLLFGIGACAALLVCVLGAHSLMRRHVLLQGREIAVRRMLGASRGQEVRRVVSGLAFAAFFGIAAATLAVLMLSANLSDPQLPMAHRVWAAVASSLPVAVATMAGVLAVVGHISSETFAQNLRTTAL